MIYALCNLRVKKSVGCLSVVSVEVIVVSSDTSASPVSSTVQNGSTRNDVTKLQRKKSRSRSRSQSESRSVFKGKILVQGDRCLRTRSGNSETRSGDRSCSVEEHTEHDGHRSRSPSSSRKRRLKTNDQNLS